MRNLNFRKPDIIIAGFVIGFGVFATAGVLYMGILGHSDIQTLLARKLPVVIGTMSLIPICALLGVIPILVTDYESDEGESQCSSRG